MSSVFEIGYSEDMSAIDLYNLFRRIPDATEAEARVAADTIAHVGNVATKADLKMELAELEMRLTWRMIIVASVIIGTVIGAVGLMFAYAGFFSAR